MGNKGRGAARDLDPQAVLTFSLGQDPTNAGRLTRLLLGEVAAQRRDGHGRGTGMTLLQANIDSRRRVDAADAAGRGTRSNVRLAKLAEQFDVVLVSARRSRVGSP